jgi:hypothetical protein
MVQQRTVGVARPGGGTTLRLRKRLAVELSSNCMSEVVPQPDVFGLLGGVGVESGQLVRRGGRRPRDRDHGVPILAGVAGQLVAGQLACRPAHVEAVVQHVVGGANLLEAVEEIHAILVSVREAAH